MGYDREPYVRDRVKEREDPIFITSPVLAVSLAVQPGVIDALRNRDVFRYEGVLARLLWGVPPHGLGHRKTGEEVPRVDMDALAVYSAAIRQLLDLPLPDEPITVDLTEDARAIIYQYEGWIEARIGDGGELEPIRDWMAKAAGKVVRLALVLEQFARAADPATTPESFGGPVGAYINPALNIVWAATSHAHHVLAGLEMDASMRDQRYVLSRACALLEVATLRDLYHACDQRSGLETMEELRPVVHKLIERGCLKLRSRPSRGGQPPSPFLEIHPALCRAKRNKARTEDAPRPRPDGPLIRPGGTHVTNE